MYRIHWIPYTTYPVQWIPHTSAVGTLYHIQYNIHGYLIPHTQYRHLPYTLYHIPIHTHYIGYLIPHTQYCHTPYTTCPYIPTTLDTYPVRIGTYQVQCTSDVYIIINMGHCPIVRLLTGYAYRVWGIRVPQHRMLTGHAYRGMGY